MKSKNISRAAPWVLYLLECENGTYYTGITTDLERRFAEHVFGIGARYTRANPPKRVVAVMDFPDRASASRAEAKLKKLARGEKPGYFHEKRNSQPPKNDEPLALTGVYKHK